MSDHPYPAKSLPGQIYAAARAAEALAKRRPQHESWALERLLKATAELANAADKTFDLEAAAEEVARLWLEEKIKAFGPAAAALERLRLEVHVLRDEER